MGPITIFDKSALQAFSMDESVWFDAFMLGNVTPIFYIEVLADLEKSMKAGQTPEEFVGMLSYKVPFHAVPNVHHASMIEAELMTGRLDGMDGTGRPLIGGAKPKKNADGTFSVHFDEFPEAASLSRWHEGNFLDIERGAAKQWRIDLSKQDNFEQISKVRHIFPSNVKISNLEQLKTQIDIFCKSNDKHVVGLALDIVGVPVQARPMILRKWENAGCPALDEFAPYMAHVFKVDLLYYQGVDRGFIDAKRASNKVDMAYLYYLPFCMAFVSGDNLHERTVPLFLRDDQTFVSAQDMKLALKEFDNYFDTLPEEVKALGVMRIAGYPPAHINNIVTQLWDTAMRSDWRELSAADQESRFKPRKEEAADKDFLRKMDETRKTAEDITDPSQVPGADGADQIFLKRTMPVQKGKWRMISKAQQDAINKAKKVEE